MKNVQTSDRAGSLGRCGRHFLQVLLFLSILYLAEWGLSLLLSKEPSSWGRRILNQMYQKGTIDVCFVGGSQVLQGIDCNTASELLGGNVVNLTSSQQPPAATAALVQEVLNEHPEISQIYVSLDYSLVMTDDVNLESIYIVADAMKPSLNKLRFLRKATPEEYYVNSFLPLRKGESYARSFGDIKSNIQTVLSSEYRNRTAVNGFADNEGMSAESYQALAAEYADGSKDQRLSEVVSEETLDAADNAEQEHAVDSREDAAKEGSAVTLPERSLEAIEDIIAACSENGTELVFFASPMPEFLTDSVLDYDAYVQTVAALVHAEGLMYYDYNSELSDTPAESVAAFDRNAAENFTDEYHLSGDGARQFTKLLLSGN